MIYQMMFRSMTEGENKKYGFVVDLNIHRIIEKSVVEYSSLIKPKDNLNDSIKYVLKEKIINLNSDHWTPVSNKNTDKLLEICNNIYKLYSTNIEIALEHHLDRLKFKKIIFTVDENKLFHAMFNKLKPTKTQKKKLIEFSNSVEIDKGIEKIKINAEGKLELS